ncbi:MAG: single-stranded-DNA-specific exonuclease RecJ [Candidatus Magasanikbacteria bacterium]|nr:single-stranded-DNA-specific exonuclease RecJ [Candidatus Magasanikbacteria bacterium]
MTTARWLVRPDPPETFIQEHPELPEIVSRLLYHRGLRTQTAIDEFLYPDYGENIHDPFLFRDMNRAVARIMTAKERQEKITVHGDYDADGVSASVILASLFQALNITYDVFLPHRETDGYGLNERTVRLLADQGTRLIITCDCGISNVAEVTLANSLELDVIITDHHTTPRELPPATAIIHPKVPGETYPDKNLAGGGVAFKLAQALLRHHHLTNDSLPTGESHEAFEKWLLDMVAIASVADMVPLLGESRTLTKYGLIVLNKTRRIGLQKLLLAARLRNEDGTPRRPLSAETIGFQIAPRLNAAGRMNHANVAYKLLMAEDPTEAAELSGELHENNVARQKLTDDLLRQAVTQVEEQQRDAPVLVIRGPGWSTGIVGLIASRLKDRYHRPTIVLAINASITGSGRSIAGFNLIATLQEVPDLFLKYGGHPMACGFTLNTEITPEKLQAAMIEKFNAQMKDADRNTVLNIDAAIALEDVNWELYDLLQKFEPFGQGNEKPVYLASGLTVVGGEPVGADGRHLRLMVRHHGPKIKKTIGWNLCSATGGGIRWGETLKIGEMIDLAFMIDVNEWNGNRELQLTIVDLRKSKNEKV